MAEFPALPLWTDALAADTEHLSHLEYGLYQRMLNTAWRQPSCDLPNDRVWLMRRFRLTDQEYDEICAPIIAEFWHQNGSGRLEQKRLKKERKYVKEKREKQRARAKSRWEKEKAPCRGNAAPHASGNAPTPTPTPIKKETEAKASSKKESANGSKKTVRKGTLLPDDWTPTESEIGYARKRGFTDAAISDIIENFRDHWTVGKGRNSTHKDWTRSWQTWIRNQRPIGNDAGRNRRQPGGVVAAIRDLSDRAGDIQRPEQPGEELHDDWLPPGRRIQ